MLKLKKILRKMMLFLASILVTMVLGVALFINLSPEFGGSATKEQKDRYGQSKNFKEGVFVNQAPVNMEMDFTKFSKMMRGYFGDNPNTEPKENIAVSKIDSSAVANYKGPARFIWFGHSTFLVQIADKNILIDPMFGEVPAPSPMLGAKRFSKTLPIEVEKLPNVDAVLFSHDHYDHLDYGSVQLIKDKVAMFYTPLGVGIHLEEWGVDKQKIVELDWWDEMEYLGLIFKCTPAQHFSGRGLRDRSKTLWSGWVIQSATENIFFSGDSGYGAHFKEIGEEYGPFDFAMLECGQYNELWSDIHMIPEETAQAGIDIKAKKIMPIHWGAFKLAMHPWTEPVDRVSKKATELGLPVVVPKIGEPVYLEKPYVYDENWWKQFN